MRNNGNWSTFYGVVFFNVVWLQCIKIWLYTPFTLQTNIHHTNITTDYHMVGDIIYLNIFATEYKYRLQNNRIPSNVSEVALASDLRKTFKIDIL